MEDEVEEEFVGARKEGGETGSKKPETDIYNEMEKMYREAEKVRERNEQARERELVEGETGGGDYVRETQTDKEKADKGITDNTNQSEKTEMNSTSTYQHSFSELPPTIPGLDLIGPDSGTGP